MNEGGIWEGQRKPWLRLDGESAKAFAAFNIYRKMGPRRSLSKTSAAIHGEVLGKNPTKVRQLAKWSSKNGHNWVERVTFWDEEQDRLDEIDMKESRKDMIKRHASQSLILQSKSLEKLKDINPADLSANDALRMLTEAIRIERLTRGVPDQHIAHSGAMEITQKAQWVDDIPKKDVKKNANKQDTTSASKSTD